MEAVLYRVLRNGSLAVAAIFMWASMPVQAHAIEAYVFRGAGDFTFIADRLSFSEGMDTLGDKIRKAGSHSSVYRWEAGEFAYREIMRRKPESVALIGHSMGALTAMAIAARLKGSGIRVAYLGTIDIPGPVGATPSNVEVAENYYHAYPIFGQLTKGPGHRGSVSNQFVWGQIHITMDNSTKVHNAMLAAIGAARGQEGEILQARTDNANGDDIAAAVDPILTASTSSAGAAGEPAVDWTGAGPAPVPPATDYSRGETRLAWMVPASVPVPTRRPARYDTKTGLPPIE